MWHYAPQRLRMGGLPAVDYNLGDWDGRQIAGYTIRKRLSVGADERIFEVDPPAGSAEAAGQMIKVVPKSSVQTSIGSVRRIQRTWQIMMSLSEHWQHPNIIRSYQLYHSPRNIYMRMEHCGTESLHQRLRARTAGSKTLTSAQLQSLVRQMSNAVHHLHSGPRICHRDIKPESWVLTERPTGEIRLKLVNFDIAVVQRPGGSCRLKSGTFPFVAPEVAAKRYDGMAWDMWSMGVLLLELACGIRIIERCIMETFSGDWRTTEADGFPLKAVQHLRDSLTEDNSLML